MDFLATKDGRSEPRSEQIAYLKHLQECWIKYRVHAAELPPGIGKSYIARTIQRSLPGVAIVTCNNQLVNQYCETYPQLNDVKGKDYYDTLDLYKRSRQRALRMDNVFNPLSYYYFHLCRPELPKPTTVIIDEAHKLGDMLLSTISQGLNCREYSIPMGLSDVGFFEWLTAQTAKLSQFHSDGTATGNKARLSSMYERLKLMHEYLKVNLHRAEVKYETLTDFKGRPFLALVVTPLEVPASLMDTIFGDARIVLLSGTLPVAHVQELFPNETSMDYAQLESPADGKKSPIYYAPIPKADRRSAPAIAASIREIYLREGKPRTLVHVTYAMGAALEPLLKDLKPLRNTKETKAEVIETFKARGGIFLGSGVAEGLDLPGDLCRLIIIPLLLYPNRGDQAVIKRLALKNGEYFYTLETLITTVQQLGRGIRGADDYCTTYILDCMWPHLKAKHADWLAKGIQDRCIDADKKK